jgi:hypothetical protein
MGREKVWQEGRPLICMWMLLRVGSCLQNQVDYERLKMDEVWVREEKAVPKIPRQPHPNTAGSCVRGRHNPLRGGFVL